MIKKEISDQLNEEYGERLELVTERIRSIQQNPGLGEACDAYFRETAGYLLLQGQVLKELREGLLAKRSEASLRELNRELYAPALAENYEKSFLNPAWAVRELGPFGQSLSALYYRLLSINPRVFQGNIMYLSIYSELFVELYGYFEEKASPDRIRSCIRSFMRDYEELFAEYRVNEMVDPAEQPFADLVMEKDAEDISSLYLYGSYVTENERRSREFLNRLSEKEIHDMAFTLTEGYRIGFQVCSKDISLKSSACLVYPLGFERVIRQETLELHKIGLASTYLTEPEGPNRQMDYDHKEDMALWLDKEYVEYRLECLKNAYEKKKSLAPKYGGPAVTESFGRVPFEPVEKEERLTLSEDQRKLEVRLRSETLRIRNTYIHGEERSFSIIDYPVAEIGDRYEEIFAETVKLNTLDYQTYQRIQQKLIDVLDQADRVHITGQGKNQTDLYVKIARLSDPQKETAFENCVADVNIPVGEVFTTPVMQGTEGRLHVSQVYLEGLNYLNLDLTFEQGIVKTYSCSNFDDPAKNKKYIEDNILFHHDFLPMGEFAIGTNTTAYRMGRVYGIADKLPILIAEKTGPHFAVGDTCYSYDEDNITYNPDGKRIIARDNDYSILRKQDVSRAYFNCHTDITIPYDEIGAITVIRPDGSTIDLLRAGRFVLEGTEELNLPLEDL